MVNFLLDYSKGFGGKYGVQTDRVDKVRNKRAFYWRPSYGHYTFHMSIIGFSLHDSEVLLFSNAQSAQCK